VVKTVEDEAYLKACVENGQERFGPFGASARIANLILQHLDEAMGLRQPPGQSAGDGRG
jgi:hypothetical protein